MSFISQIRKQKAVYWRRAGGYDNYGQPAYDSPVEIGCRWEDVSEEYFDSEGEKAVSDSHVYVDRDMEVGDVLLLGELESGIADSPFDNDDVATVKKFEKTPDLRATEFLREVYL